MTIRAILGIASVLIVTASVSAQGAADIAKRIAQFDSSDFRTREEARKSLEKLGAAALPELRKAKAGNLTPETSRRVDLVIQQIESTLLQADEKRWNDFSPEQRSIRERVVWMVARMPGDRDLAVALYLVSTAKRPSEAATVHAHKQLKESPHRLMAALEIARTQVKSQYFNRDVALANAQVLKLQKDVFAGAHSAERWQLLGGDPAQKLTKDVAGTLTKAAKADAHYCDIAFLITVMRYPTASEYERVVQHLQVRKGDEARADIIWALINTKEFITPVK